MQSLAISATKTELGAAGGAHRKYGDAAVKCDPLFTCAPLLDAPISRMRKLSQKPASCHPGEHHVERFS